ncbi:MAG: hypothetical protein M0Q95_10555 [Porticoccaceae bacterium]|nr:hypothetical protein [Porticoccaceae bacterium]
MFAWLYIFGDKTRNENNAINITCAPDRFDAIPVLVKFLIAVTVYFKIVSFGVENIEFGLAVIIRYAAGIYFAAVIIEMLALLVSCWQSGVV